MRKVIFALVLLAPLAAHAQNGLPGTGINPPTGGVGILGYLSGIYQKLSNTLNATITGALPAGTNSIGAVTPTPGTATAPLAAGTNAFQFTVTPSDQALSVSPSNPGLTLPGKICLTNPQQTFGTGVTNLSYVNVNWSGGNSLTAPSEQIAPGVGEVCWFLNGTTAPHVSVNNPAGSNVSIGVQQ